MNAAKNKRLDLFLTDQASEDCDWWSAENPKLLKRINDLIDNCRDTPFSGIGKPEPLKYELAGQWSRRINKEHRLVYQVEVGTLFVLSCRYHYQKSKNQRSETKENKK